MTDAKLTKLEKILFDKLISVKKIYWYDCNSIETAGYNRLVNKGFALPEVYGWSVKEGAE